MQKGSERTTKYHIRHQQKLRQRKMRNRQLKIDRKNYDPRRVEDRQKRKAQGEMARYWANLKWYQRVWLKIKYWLRK